MALKINGIDTPPLNFPALDFTLPDGSPVIVEFRPYQLPAAGADIVHHGESAAGLEIRRLREAIYHIVHRVSRYAPANAIFARLPRGRTLWQLITDTPDIIICHSPANFRVKGASPVVTAAHPSASEMRLSLTGQCFHGRSASGRRVEASILHELAHLNGATDSPASHVAENVLLQSRFGDQYDPTATG